MVSTEAESKRRGFVLGETVAHLLAIRSVAMGARGPGGSHFQPLEPEKSELGRAVGARLESRRDAIDSNTQAVLGRRIYSSDS